MKKFFTLIVAFLFITNLAFAEENNNNKENKDNEEHVMLILENNTKVKPIEEITVLDIIKNEQTSPELKERIVQLLNQSQYEIDKYRTTMSSHYKQVELKMQEFKEDLNRLQTSKDELEVNLGLAKWMIISLSVGIVCLISVVLVIWKNFLNTSKNDVEIIYSQDQFRKKIKTLEKRVELLEEIFKKNGKQE